jgi:hypothetical protein
VVALVEQVTTTTTAAAAAAAVLAVIVGSPYLLNSMFLSLKFDKRHSDVLRHFTREDQLGGR